MARTDFSRTRAQVHLPEGVIYLDGNSLGPLPRAAGARMAQCLGAEWGTALVRAWNSAGWVDQPMRLGDRIGRLIGAPAGSTVVGDTLSIQVYQALSAALALRPDRRVVLSDSGNFPSDLYMAEGLLRTLGRGHELRIVAPEEVAAAITDAVAVLLLTEVDYRTAQRHDMAALTRAAHAAGALTVWDLAHSAGALAVDVTACRADFAVGCTYKYLNAGPGAPAFIHVAPRLADAASPALAGWFGHARPFDFARDHHPAEGAARMRIGTPPVLQMAALEAALDIWEDVAMADVAAQSARLSEAFREAVARHCPSLTLASPADPARRGSHLAYRHPQAYAVMQALIARGVIGDFRAPDLLRFGFAPLYNTEADIARAVGILSGVLRDGTWDRPEYHARAAVT